MTNPTTQVAPRALQTLKLSKPRRPDTTRYWFVWAPTRNRPRQRHTSLNAALAEAERLAAMHPGVAFIAYEARSIARRMVQQ
jgi:hypothetical protein